MLLCWLYVVRLYFYLWILYLVRLSSRCSTVTGELYSAYRLQSRLAIVYTCISLVCPILCIFIISCSRLLVPAFQLSMASLIYLSLLFTIVLINFSLLDWYSFSFVSIFMSDVVGYICMVHSVSSVPAFFFAAFPYMDEDNCEQLYCFIWHMF